MIEHKTIQPMKKIYSLLIACLLGLFAQAQNCNFILNSPPGNQVTVSPQPIFILPPFISFLDFGDGTTVGMTNFNAHTYANPGNYVITQTVIDTNSGFTICTSTQNAVLNGCPIIYSQIPNSGIYNFIHDATTAGAWTQWDFGDGSPIVVGDTVSHTYTTPGTYIVNMSEYNGLLILCTSSVQVTYSTTGNNCSYSVLQPNPLGGPNTFEFTASVPSSGGTITWDFGDGNTGAGTVIQHTYPGPGTYSACMTYINGVDTCNYCTNILCTATLGNCTFTLIPDTTVTNGYTFVGVPGDSSSSIVWLFGDGGTAVGPTATHQYTAGGIYNVCMQEIDTATGAVLCAICYNLTINPLPQCDFIYSNNPANPFEYNFISLLPLPTYTYVWDFNDGGIDSTINATHTFAAPGTYIVCLKVYQGAGSVLVCQFCQPVTVTGAQNCYANFTSVSVGLNTYFIDQSVLSSPTMPPFPPPATYNWTFGDGTTSTLQFPQHNYTSAGSYNVCLTVSNGFCTATFCDTVIVDTTIINPNNCNAYFIFTQLAPFQLIGVNLSSGFNLTFNWDFGDGTTSTGPYPMHQYTSFGTFPICLTVSDPIGCTDTYCDSLTVDSSGMIIYRGTSVGFMLNIVSPSQLTSGLSENSKVAGTIYPNPTSGELNITLVKEIISQVDYRILSIDGRIIQTGQLTGLLNTIDVQNIDNGIYLIELSTITGQRETRRFTKQ